jgi:hypothetical protein
LDPGYPLHVTLENKEASLTTLRHPQATDQDCKIDAVLLAKAVMDLYPKEVSRIKLVLSASNSDNMQEVTVTTGDVKAYATGTISKEDLLTSLELKKAENAAGDKDSNMDLQTEGTTPVAPGFLRPQRQLLAGRIEKLKANGTGTKPFEEMLAKIEGDVQKPVSEVSRIDLHKEINELYGRLNEQEQAIRAAQHIANGANSSAAKFFQGQDADKAEGPPKGRPGGQWQNGMHHQSQIWEKIEELRMQHHDVTSFMQQAKHIRQLEQDGRKDEAHQERQDLAAKLGITLQNKKNNNGGGP